MKQYQVFYMYRHIPPEGKVHIRPQDLATITAYNERSALIAAKLDHPNIAPHLAVQRLNSRGELI
jgi:hypothetical protein